MAFGKITDNQFNAVRGAKDDAEIVKRYATRLSKGLNDLLNDDYPVETWGTAFSLREDGLGADLSTPFGEGRACVVVCVGAGEVQARYIFEKKCNSDGSRPAYHPVWAVRITKGGHVMTDDGSELLFDMNVFSQAARSNGVVAVALSALYAIAEHEHYWAPLADN